MNRETAATVIVEHAAELKERGVTSIYLFGSVARGDQKQNSDVDIFFEYANDMQFSAFDLMEIQDFLKGILGERTDVVPKNSLHRRIRDQAIAEAIQVF